MKLLSIFFALIVLFQNCESCDPTPTSCEQVFHFEIPFSISPIKDTFQLGDTIWLESVISDSLIDSKTGQKIEVKNFDFEVLSSLARIDTLGYGNPIKHANVYNIHGQFRIIPLTPESSRVHIDYEKMNSHREFKAGLVLIKEGIFQISFANIRTHLEEDINLIDTECNQKIQLEYNMNDRGDNNYHLEEFDLNEIPDEELFNKSGGYNFVVIE